MLRSQGPGVAVLGIVMNTKELGVYAAQFWATSTILLPMIGEYNAVFKGLLTVDDLHEQVRKHIFVCHFILKPIILPRQARDEKEKNSKKRVASSCLAGHPFGHRGREVLSKRNRSRSDCRCSRGAHARMPVHRSVVVDRRHSKGLKTFQEAAGTGCRQTQTKYCEIRMPSSWQLVHALLLND
jgi:hypothetical protein